MANRNEVEQFLKDFRQKLKVFQIIYADNRKKNAQALLELEITPAKRREIIEQIEVPDYSDGPLNDNLYGNSSLWVFGKYFKNNEVYIKISMGQPNSQVICISFHIAEYRMNYPFKKQQL